MRKHILLAACAPIIAAWLLATVVAAHHSFGAEYDANAPITLPQSRSTDSPVRA